MSQPAEPGLHLKTSNNESTKEPLHLLKLPLETRKEIYILALSFDEHGPNILRSSCPGRIRTVFDSSNAFEVMSDRSALLRVCKQVYRETKDIIYAHNVFEFQEVSDSERTLMEDRNPIFTMEMYEKMKQLQFISIAQKDDDIFLMGYLFEMYGVGLSHAGPTSSPFWGEAESFMPNLQAVHIRCDDSEVSIDVKERRYELNDEERPYDKLVWRLRTSMALEQMLGMETLGKWNVWLMRTAAWESWQKGDLAQSADIVLAVDGLQV